MKYFSEILGAWRPLLAAMMGLATGNSIVGIVTSAIVPALIKSAGWTKSQFALVGSLSLLGAIFLPAIGRLADHIGVKKTATIGLTFVPLVYLAYSFCAGSLVIYVLIYFVQITICVTTTAMIYTRLVIKHVEHARGFALAIVASSPAIAGIVLGPILNNYVETNGWQASYRALALLFSCTGIFTYFLIPSDRPEEVCTASRAKSATPYRTIFQIPAFWVLAGAMLLCNLPQTLLLTQLKLLVMDQGITGVGAAVMFSALSFGMLAGRIITGIALDRFPPQLVAFVAMGVPSAGLFLLASPLDAPLLVMLAIFFLGFAFGAEGDAIAYLVARYFVLDIYSSVMGLLTASVALSSALGAVILSVTLDVTRSFNLFLILTGTSVAAGAVLLLKLGGCVARSTPDNGQMAGGSFATAPALDDPLPAPH